MSRRTRARLPHSRQTGFSRVFDPHQRGAPFRGRRHLNVEHLEQRLLMTVCDDVCFIPDLPEPLPVPGVAQAAIITSDDYATVEAGQGARQIHVLANDVLSSGTALVRIKAVSPSRLGGQVSISADGQSLLYTPPAEGSGQDSFFYIVEDTEGNLGQANVKVNVQPRLLGPVNDRFTVLEDARNVRFDVLNNDRDFASGSIVEVTEPDQGGALMISTDGRSLVYSPATGRKGYESFSYTVADSEGNHRTASVSVSVRARFLPYRDQLSVDIDAPSTALDVLVNDAENQNPQAPRIVDVSTPNFSGTVQIDVDGTSLIYQPAPGFQGRETFTYTVRYGPLDHHLATETVVMSVVDPYLAVDNYFAVAPDSNGNALDLLANDTILAHSNLTTPERTLRIVSADQGSEGGQVSVSGDGRQILYTPAAGFIGREVFTYTVVDNTGHRDTGHVTLDVTPPVVDPFNLPRFTSRAELEQYLLDEAVQRFGRQFGNRFSRYVYDGPPSSFTGFSDLRVTQARTTNGIDHSDTNTQHAGIDEADVVETDGYFLYFFSGGRLSIVDLRVVSRPQLIAVMELGDQLSEMYLHGDRITLLSSGGYSQPAVVVELDVSRRDDPQLLRRTEFDGRIIDSRAIGDKVHLVISRGVQLPPLESRTIDETPATTGGLRIVDGVYETLDEYVARVGGSLAEASLPMFRTFGPDGQLLESGLLSDATQIHRPIAASDSNLLSIVTLDLADETTDRLSSVSLFTAYADQIYVSPAAVYVMRADGERIPGTNQVTSFTSILKFTLTDNRAASLEAAGRVRGRMLNQFSADEHDGRLRIVTTETIREDWRRVRTQNHLFVLEHRGAGLETIGSLANLAPTESVRSVRFMGDRAFVVTFREIDPLLAIDLADPAAPRLKGALHIPGFSNYLHPIGEDYLIGFGRDADPVTGAVQSPQVSLFYVGNLNNPRLVDRMTLEGADWTFAEAFTDHHAVAYFPKQHVLSIPIDWRTSSGEGDEDRLFSAYETHSAAWVFRVEASGATGQLEFAARIEHDASVRRSVRVGSALLTVSADQLRVHDVNNPDVPLGELFIGLSPRDDVFDVQEDESTLLDVRANDRPGANGAVSRIVDVSQPISYQFRTWGLRSIDANQPPGTVEIVDDGRALRFTPRADFFGSVTFTYTVFDQVRGKQTARVTVHVENVLDDPTAAADRFEVQPDSRENPLDVLANDSNPDVQPGRGIFRDIGDYDPVLRITPSLAFDSEFQSFDPIPVTSLPGTISQLSDLSITDVGPADNGGTVNISEDGQRLLYTPAAGFQGIETFTYTVTTPHGLSAIATVTIIVGDVPEPVQRDPRSNAADAEQAVPIEPAPIESPETTPQIADPHILAERDSIVVTSPADLAALSATVLPADIAAAGRLFTRIPPVGAAPNDGNRAPVTAAVDSRPTQPVEVAENLTSQTSVVRHPGTLRQDGVGASLESLAISSPQAVNGASFSRETTNQALVDEVDLQSLVPDWFLKYGPR